jgi:predicted NUDIX family NTP pyrophosphohydrolase
VLAWAFDGSAQPFDPERAPPSNTFELEWPPRSGRTATFPEIDRAEWMTLPLARVKVLEAQRALLDRLEAIVSAR